jgi:hypothetical protein
MVRGRNQKTEVCVDAKPVDAPLGLHFALVTSSAAIRQTTRRDRTHLVDVSFRRDAATWVVVCANHRFVKLDID